MTQTSNIYLDLLNAVEWFEAVGMPFDRLDLIQVSSWQEAQTTLRRYSKQGRYVLPANQLRYLLRDIAGSRYQQWDQIADAIREPITTLVESKTTRLAFKPDTLKLVRDMISWDIMHACMENEYADVCTLNYHRYRVEMIVAGHIACGWQGAYPEGKYVVY